MTFQILSPPPFNIPPGSLKVVAPPHPVSKCPPPYLLYAYNFIIFNVIWILFENLIHIEDVEKFEDLEGVVWNWTGDVKTSFPLQPLPWTQLQRTAGYVEGVATYLGCSKEAGYIQIGTPVYLPY